ncbi:cytochrome c biogenesis protein CcmG, thiol:disulfide interchange protein DsbE [Fontimonas thermophila]|uniref:Cytochrome c biogenesis protein CcmG, thiol:disulfide interchange protein DsbE n=1 Tax=Fontimonas thermophila TaxID=1076937 RepID=A0A1I2IT80_9GAMM|nr:DsbE family thiol:disulfide interchange protein [Fontimonas thermophila]SFF45632.1 cytochrome c biogenesis protein CcmG, thiol:disulfide interchange protein DsbE [Fontimonas thermophila]
MRIRYLLPALVLVGLVLLFAFGLQHDPRQIPSPLIGKPAPAFTLRLLGEQTPYTQEQLRGRPLLVNFWASWCAGCLVEHPFLMELARRGVEIVGIDYKDTDTEALRWLARHGNPYRTIAADTEGRAGLDWGVYGVPETFVLDAQGIIVYKHIGPLDEEAWRTKIAPLLAGGAG